MAIQIISQFRGTARTAAAQTAVGSVHGTIGVDTKIVAPNKTTIQASKQEVAT